MKKSYTLISPCFFGMEKMLAREIKDLGFEIIKTEDGRITYKTGEDGIAKANMWLRCAERVHLKVAEFEAKTFDELFENTKRINWSRYIPYGAQFPVSKASSIKSKLYSTTDIQAIVKKAIVDSLKKSYMESGMLKEDKEKYPIYVFLHKDKVTISIDTYKSKTAEEAIKAGADIINDIWGAKYDKNIAKVAAKYNVPIILMHNREDKPYENLMEDVINDLQESIDIALEAGVKKENIILDPGIGFAKTYEENLIVMNKCEVIKAMGYPVLLGTSRKSMIGLTLNLPVNERVEGTLATTVMGIMKGMEFIRVHDVLENKRVAVMTDTILKAK